ncbi:putative transposase [Rhizobium sp. BK313]|nr:putative transposase [Rhizobium sp. BK313]
MIQAAVSHKHHRFLPAVISHAVWLYVRFPLSLRLVEEMLLERGIAVSYETVRSWVKKFGPHYSGRAAIACNFAAACRRAALSGPDMP